MKFIEVTSISEDKSIFIFLKSINYIEQEFDDKAVIYTDDGACFKTTESYIEVTNRIRAAYGMPIRNEHPPNIRPIADRPDDGIPF